MHFEPIEFTEKDKQWMEAQQTTRNAIINAFKLDSNQMTVTATPWVEGQTGMIVAPVEEPKPEHTPEQKALVRGMNVCSEVARMYKRRGQPPKWVKLTKDEHDKQAWVEDTDHDTNKANRVNRRAIRLKMHMQTQPDQYACGTCNLPFIGPSSNRCQCKPAKPMETQQRDEDRKNLINALTVSPIQDIPRVA